jgi:hypothetical protein
MIINVELLNSLGACEDGIERFIKHFNGTLELPDDITEYAVCNELYSDLRWLAKELHLSIKCINKDTETWETWQFDSNNNITYYEKSNGYWYKKGYDADGNRIYQESKVVVVRGGYVNNILTYFGNSLKEIKGTKRA